MTRIDDQSTLLQARDPALDRRAAEVEAERVAELQAERLGQAFLDAQAALLVAGPASGGDLVVRRQRRAVAEVELAVDQALGARVGVVVGGDVLAVDRDQPAADHREPVVAADARGAQLGLEGLGLRRLDVDDEAVRRVLRRRLAPARDQVGAQQREQHQREQADGERRDLQHRERRPRRELACRQHQPARRARLGHRAAQDDEREPRQEREDADRAGEAADRDQAELEVARDREQQRREAERAGAEDRERCRLHRADVAPDDAQRRHARELEHRRQAEAEQQREADAGAEQRRPDARRRQHRLDQPGEQPDEDVVDGEAEDQAGDAGDEADQRELDQVLQRDRSLRQAEDAQHRAVVEVAAGEVARGDADRDRGEQRREQRDQVEELLGPVERLAHLGPAGGERLDPDAAQVLGLDLGLGPVDELVHAGVVGGVGRDREAIDDPARRLHQAGRRQVGDVEHHARREAREAGAAIGLDDDDPLDLEARIAEQERVADGEAERVEQRRVDPRRARRRRLGDVDRPCRSAPPPRRAACRAADSCRSPPWR